MNSTSGFGDQLVRQLRRRLPVNLDRTERNASMLAGLGLGIAAATRSDRWRWILFGAGVSFLLRGASGFCVLYRGLGVDHADQRARDGVPGNAGLKIEHAVDVVCPAPELYNFWRQIEQLPRILRHVESVEVIDEWHSHWIARGLIGPGLEWDAEIINDHENELIAWQSMHGATLRNAGSVRFEPLSEGSTRVKVSIELHPLGGGAAIAVAKLFGTDPQRELEEDLARFKDFAERELSPASNSIY